MDILRSLDNSVILWIRSHVFYTVLSKPTSKPWVCPPDPFLTLYAMKQNILNMIQTPFWSQTTADVRLVLLAGWLTGLVCV